MAIYQPIILTGDYVGVHDRQQNAANAGCICVVEFHFNSAGDATASGGEVHYKQNDIISPSSKEFADSMWAELVATGLPPHGNQPVKSTAVATRSGWIDFYSMFAIVLEPLFISNAGQATWLHANKLSLADAIAAAIKGTFLNGGAIGLSAGHAGKSVPDPGAPCVLGDTEADHTVEIRDLVAARM
ncbi:MAG: N-acetylmuramoyl-L-alanine amidase [Gemmatales bacterium]